MTLGFVADSSVGPPADETERLYIERETEFYSQTREEKRQKACAVQ